MPEEKPDRSALRRHAVQMAEATWEIPADAKPGMRVPARIYATSPCYRGS
jgi:hypothetical protein